jgi:20S proteasome alpha/beta subunit
MQTDVFEQESSVKETKVRPVTYQLILCGVDGVVLASDRRELRSAGPGDEGEGMAINMVKKIRIDPTGCFAWAFAGGEISHVASGYFERSLEDGKPLPSTEDVRRRIIECCDRAWQDAARGPNPGSTIILAHGPTRTILRAKLGSYTTVEEMQEGRCFAGQTYSVATFFPRRFYSGEMSVSVLLRLASYTVRAAHHIDPLCVDGLDVATYRDSTGKFEFENAALCLERADRLDDDIQRFFADRAG